MRENCTSGSMRRGEKRVMVHSANGHRTRKGGNSGAPPDLHTTALALHSTVHRGQCDNRHEFPFAFALAVQALGIQHRYIKPAQERRLKSQGETEDQPPWFGFWRAPSLSEEASMRPREDD